MKLQLLAACVAASTLAAGAALAAEPVTAKLQAPVAEKTKFIAGGAMFVCEADTCVASAPMSQTFSTGACKAIASKVGPVVSFGARKSFEADRLADCNATAIAKAGAGPQLAKQ
ncbi:CC_3452 family protein [Phenylobacterium sp.]|jgi:hypothetical protein|uniref:CC_3452 family protein n=1 Tax=Phenylobacterium sp. TaxID=1871053 RepID=UPI002F91EB33